MISNHATNLQDLDDFEQLLVLENFTLTNRDETNHAMNELVKKLYLLNKEDKHNEHCVRIKKIVKQMYELEEKVKKYSQVAKESGLHIFENFFYDREEALKSIERNVDEAIDKHINFVVREVVYGHTVEKDIFDSVRHYSDLASLPEGELHTGVYDSYIQNIADEALQNDYDHGSFDLFKRLINEKIETQAEINFTHDSERHHFRNYLNRLTDRQWDTIIKTALL